MVEYKYKVSYMKDGIGYTDVFTDYHEAVSFFQKRVNTDNYSQTIIEKGVKYTRSPDFKWQRVFKLD